jgi:hypothetical protein
MLVEVTVVVDRAVEDEAIAAVVVVPVPLPGRIELQHSQKTTLAYSFLFPHLH